MRGMRGINTLAPMFLPEIISASNKKLCMALIINLVSFACPFAPFMFRNNMIGAPTLSTNLWGGIPEGIKSVKKLYRV
jgi:hypothetical protein